MKHISEVKEGALRHGSITVLSYQLNYPVFQDSLISRRINAVTSKNLASKIEMAEGIYYKNACKRYSILGKYNNFTQTKITSDFQIMYNSSPMLSWFADYNIDLAEDGGFIERVSHNWDTVTGSLLRFENLFRPNSQWHSICMRNIEKSIEKIEEEIGTYCNPNWREYARQSMKNGRFYVTDDGIALWFVQGSIASNLWCLPTVHINAANLEGFLNKKYFNN